LVSRVILCLPVSALEEGNEERSARFKDFSTTIHFFRDFQNVDLQCIYMPYVLNEKDRTNFLYALSDHRASVSDLPWEMNSPAHFIDISSFNDFLRRFFTDDRPGDREMYIDPDFAVSVSDDILQNTALKKYHPAESSSLVGRLRKINEKIHAHEIGSRIASAVGVFAGSVLIEFLMRILSGYSVFQTIDFLFSMYFADYKSVLIDNSVFAAGVIVFTSLIMKYGPLRLFGLGFCIGTFFYLLISYVNLRLYTANLEYEVLAKKPFIASEKRKRRLPAPGKA